MTGGQSQGQVSGCAKTLGDGCRWAVESVCLGLGSADRSLGGDLRCQRRVPFGRLRTATSLVRLTSIAKRY